MPSRRPPLRLPFSNGNGNGITNLIQFQQSKAVEEARAKFGIFYRESNFYPFGKKVAIPLIAEFIGLFFLTFIGASQQVSFSTIPQELNASLSAASLDLDAIGGRSASPVVVGITLALLINALVHLSGANLNPTASMGFLTIGDLPWQLFVPYILAQILGSTLGAAFVRALMPPEKYLVGSGGMILTIGDGAKAFGVEVVICFFMMFIAFTSACDQPANAVFAYSIGFTVTVSLYAFGPITGACMNPARSMGAILAAYGFDFGASTPALFRDAWISTGIYFAGDLLGGFLAGVVYRKIAKNDKYGVSWKVVQKCVKPDDDDEEQQVGSSRNTSAENGNNNDRNNGPKGSA